MPQLNDGEKKAVQEAGNKAYHAFIDDKHVQPLAKTGRYAFLGTWIPVLGNLVGAVIGGVKDHESHQSLKTKAAVAQKMAEYFEAKKQGASDTELKAYQQEYVAAHQKAKEKNDIYATPWGTLSGGLNIAPEDRKAIFDAGEEARKNDKNTAKRPVFGSKAFVFGVIGTFLFPLVGTIIGAVIGKAYSSNATKKIDQHADMEAAKARLQKADALVKDGKYTKEDITDFVRDHARSEKLYDQEYRRTSATEWGAGIGTLLWLPGSAIGALIGKVIDKNHNVDAKRQADAHATKKMQHFQATGDIGLVNVEEKGADKTRAQSVASDKQKGGEKHVALQSENMPREASSNKDPSHQIQHSNAEFRQGVEQQGVVVPR